MNTEVFRWRPGIGDPSVEAWLVCFLYLSAALLAYRKSVFLKNIGNLVYQTWAALSVILLFLAFNKQLDLQTIISDLGRWIALSLDLMEERHIFKRAFILFTGLSGLSFAFIFRRSIYTFINEYKLAFTGVLALVVFIFLRATSFHIFSDSLNIMLNKFLFFQSLEIVALITILFSLIVYKSKGEVSLAEK